jgi:hypothetical protein
MSDQLELFDSPVDVDGLATPNEVIQHDGFTVSIYRPQPLDSIISGTQGSGPNFVNRAHGG